MTDVTQPSKKVHATKSYNKALNEYTIKLYIDSVHQVDADYYTDDKDDAISTALYIVKKAQEDIVKRDALEREESHPGLAIINKQFGGSENENE